MRALRRLGLLVFLAGLSTCGLDTFDVSQKATTMIQGKSPLQMVLGNVGFGAFNNFDITQEQSLKNQGVKKEQIDSVHVTQLKMTITAPSGEDFTFLTKLEFFVSSPGLEKKRIASGGPFPAGQSSVFLMIDDVDLKPYAAAPSMDITTTVAGQPPDHDTTVEAQMDLNVDVDVGGAICG